jgi:hypothetical protein
MLKHLNVFFRHHKESDYFIYLWLFLLCVLCYGILIPFLGFYWDDLPYLFQYHSFGLAGFPEFVASDRPFSAWIFMLTTGLFKFNPIGYHLFAFVLRFIGVMLFYQIIKEIWLEKKTFNFFTSSIFAVYPGFLQQPIALIYCHHFSVLAIFLLSILLMVKVAKAQKINGFVFGLSILGSFHMFSIENFAVLELIRPFIIWLVLKKEIADKKKAFQKVLLLWLPYLIIFCSFLVWRVFVFKFPTYQPGFFEELEQNPYQSIFELFKRIPLDFYTTTVGAWVKSLTIPQVSNFGKSATLIFWVLTIFTSVIAFIFAAFKSDDEKIAIGYIKDNLSIFTAGIILFFLAGSIVWVLGLPLDIKFAWDRMTLAFIPAAAILFGALLDLPRKYRIIPNLIFALLVSMAVGSHFENGMRFKRDWENIKNMQWQLSWRVPDLQENTTLITSEPGLNYYSDNSLTSPLNMLYSDQKSDQLEYFLYFSDVRLGLGLKKLEQDIPIVQRYRSFSFTGNTSDVIAYKFNPPSCLQIMDRVFSNSITNPNLSDLQTKELRLTNLELIRNYSQNSPEAYLFGSEPEESWCYYFEKADLSRQYGNFSRIVALGDEAISKDFYPRSASEWLPFLEGYAWEGRWDKVDFIINEISESEGNYRQGMCYTLKRIKNHPQFPSIEKLQDYLKRYNCQ